MNANVNVNYSPVISPDVDSVAKRELSRVARREERRSEGDELQRDPQTGSESTVQSTALRLQMDRRRVDGLLGYVRKRYID